MGAHWSRGFSLTEMVAVAAVIAVLAIAAIPMMAAPNEVRLDAASTEVGNALRFALAESRRTGGYVLVDAGTRPGHVLLLSSDAAATPGADVIDPVTKRAMDIDVFGSAFSAGVRVSPKFVAASGTYPQLLIGPGPVFAAAQASAVMGPLQAASGIELTLGSRTVKVAFDSVTGRVTAP